MSFPAESYERVMVPALFAPWAACLLESVNTQRGERVLDLACGTGIVARQLAASARSPRLLFGLDLNPDMLRMAHTAAGLRIGWSAGRAEQLPFPDSAFDLLICQFGLMFFADRHAGLREMRRVLRRGGRLVLSVWQGLDQHPFYQTLHDLSQRRLGTSGVQGAFSLGDLGELRHLLSEAGFSQITIEPASITARFSDPQAFLTWEIDVDPAAVPALSTLDAQAQQAVLDALRHDMQIPLREIMQDNALVIPFHAHIAQARR